MKRVGIRMEILAQIIEDLNNNEELKEIFGDPVSLSLAVIAEYSEGNLELRIEEKRGDPLDEEENRRFVEVLNRVVTTNFGEDQYSRASNWVFPTAP